jgi:hypothetical protein
MLGYEIDLLGSGYVQVAVTLKCGSKLIFFMNRGKFIDWQKTG